jgi:hypothetical protein
VAVVGVAVLVVVGATAIAALRLAALRSEAGWRPPPPSVAAPPPPLGGSAPVAFRRVTATMSLDSVASAGGVPVVRLIEALHLPAGVSRTAPLRTLMHRHGFTLRDVERVVEDDRKQGG